MIQGLLYAITSATAFGLMAIFVKLGYDAGLDGAVMMQYRFTYATVILACFLLVKDRSLLKISLPGLINCIFLGLIVYWLQTTCFVSALATIPASTTALVLYGHPAVVALLSWMFLGMKLDRTVLLSLVLVMSGCCLVFYDAFLREVEMTGLMYAFGAMAFFSCYLVLVQLLLKNMKPLTATFYVMLFASVSFTLSGDPGVWFKQTQDSMMIGLALGIIPGAIAITFLFLAIEKIGSAYACIFSSIEPVVTLAAAAIVLDENVVLLQMGGAALIVMGIVIPNAQAAALHRSTVKNNLPGKR